MFDTVVSFGVKSNLHYTRGITPKRVTNVWIHFGGLVPAHCFEEASQRWRAVGECVQFNQAWNRTPDVLRQ